MQYIKNILIGIILGVSNVIPGISAGTMAVVMNVYDRLLAACTIDLDQLKKDLSFLVTIGIGVGVGVLVFSHAITYLFNYYPMQTKFTFMGVIVGSIPMIIGHAKKEGPILKRNLLPAIITFVIMIIMAIMEQTNQVGGIGLSSGGIGAAVALLVSGAVAAFAMIIPGISGSFIMVTLGTYDTVIAGISNFNIPVIMMTGVGVLIGLLLGVKLVKILLQRYNQPTYMAILGLVIGSVFVIYPGFTLDRTGIAALIMFVVGGVGAYRFAD